MLGALVHIGPEDSVKADVRAGREWTGSDGHVYPAQTTAVVNIGDLTLTMSPEQAARLRDALAEALEAGGRPC